ncbi:GntR family transcriptional regulator [Aureimonas glaciei]|nr:GntR family transcriptional regulator [Aureimonas glaciei]
MSKTSSDKVHSAIIERIMTGELRPGDVLNEIPLAEAFGLSRTPVREALHRLNVLGLTERGARRAFVVKRMDMSAMHDLFESVAEMEGLVSGMAADRMTASERQTLTAIVMRGESAEADYGEANADFHAAIQRGAHNAVLAALLHDLSLRTLPWRVGQFRARRARIETSRSEHRAILEAILARRGDDAAQLMRAHVAASFAGILDMMG